VSRQFAFVVFESVQKAKSAREALNYSDLDKFEIRICFKRISTDINLDGNLFITNINKEVSTKKVDALFSEFGKILSCSIRTDHEGKSLGYGYIQFENEEAALNAIKNLNETEHFGTKISVSKFISAKNRVVIQNNVYIKNFPESWNKDTVTDRVKSLAESLGKVVSSGVSENKLSTGKVGYAAFVAFETHDSAQKMIEQYNNNKLDDFVESDSPLFVFFVESKAARMHRMKKEFVHRRNVTNVFVKSLVETADEEQIRTVFAKYGEITSVCIKTCNPIYTFNAQNLKFAFINFKTEQEATSALIDSKSDPEVLALLHPSHRKETEFIMYHQSKEVRQEYLRMKIKIYQSIYFNSITSPFRNINQPQYMKRNYDFGPNFNANIPSMPFNTYQNRTPTIDSRHPHQIISVNTPSTVRTSNSSSTSRQADDDEIYTLEYLRMNHALFMELDKERQNNILGNLMYSRVIQSSIIDKELAPKITGMLIDLDILDIAEIIEILENSDNLEERIKEAMEVINNNDEDANGEETEAIN
jgi:polyadenylate-binding protein